MSNKLKQAKIAGLFREILSVLGEDVERQGIRDTPKRYAKFITEFTRKEDFKVTTFDENGVDEMVIQNFIPVCSLCEHHTLPFFGTASVAFLPMSGKIVGLSKLARAVAHFASGLQNQERITYQVGEFFTKNRALNARGVAVSIRCVHTCMVIRGVKARGSMTTTQYLSGVFKTDPSTRAEFMHAVEHGIYQ